VLIASADLFGKDLSPSILWAAGVAGATRAGLDPVAHRRARVRHQRPV